MAMSRMERRPKARITNEKAAGAMLRGGLLALTYGIFEG
jgi:hypothetical protein